MENPAEGVPYVKGWRRKVGQAVMLRSTPAGSNLVRTDVEMTQGQKAEAKTAKHGHEGCNMS